MFIQIVFELMLSMALSDALEIPLQIFTIIMYGANSAYSGQRFKDLLSLGVFDNRIHKKGARNLRLNAAATEHNSIIGSKI